MTFSDPGSDGLDSSALMYRSSVSPLVVCRSTHQSGPDGGTVIALGVVMMRSGLPIAHSLRLANVGAVGMSAGLPRVAPLSAHLTIAAISSSVNDGSSLNF